MTDVPGKGSYAAVPAGTGRGSKWSLGSVSPPRQRGGEHVRVTALPANPGTHLPCWTVGRGGTAHLSCVDRPCCAVWAAATHTTKLGGGVQPPGHLLGEALPGWLTKRCRADGHSRVAGGTPGDSAHWKPSAPPQVSQSLSAPPGPLGPDPVPVAVLPSPTHTPCLPGLLCSPPHPG